MSLTLATSLAGAQATGSQKVTVENYIQAQTDVNFDGVVKRGGLGHLLHGRELAPPGQRNGIVRPNRDTFYSFVVLDLGAGPVKVTLPDPGKRYMGMQILNQKQFTPATFYGAGTYTITRQTAGTRYALAVVRFLVNPADKEDVRQVHSLQDAIQLNIQNPSAQQPPVFPQWDEVSLKNVQASLLQLGSTLSSSRGMFGAGEKYVDPVKYLIGTAMLWGGNPERDALYLPITPAENDGNTPHVMTVGEVPVRGFWSVTVYNGDGYLVPNAANAYAVNSVTAKRGPDGTVKIQFGGCDGSTPNCLPTPRGWNYTVRMFLPQPEVLDGKWTFPSAVPAPR